MARIEGVDLPRDKRVEITAREIKRPARKESLLAASAFGAFVQANGRDPIDAAAAWANDM